MPFWGMGKGDEGGSVGPWFAIKTRSQRPERQRGATGGALHHGHRLPGGALVGAEAGDGPPRRPALQGGWRLGQACLGTPGWGGGGFAASVFRGDLWHLVQTHRFGVVAVEPAHPPPLQFSPPWLPRLTPPPLDPRRGCGSGRRRRRTAGTWRRRRRGGGRRWGGSAQGWTGISANPVGVGGGATRPSRISGGAGFQVKDFLHRLRRQKSFSLGGWGRSPHSGFPCSPGRAGRRPPAGGQRPGPSRSPGRGGPQVAPWAGVCVVRQRANGDNCGPGTVDGVLPQTRQTVGVWLGKAVVDGCRQRSPRGKKRKATRPQWNHFRWCGGESSPVLQSQSSGG